jgi:hypothetical protein
MKGSFLGWFDELVVHAVTIVFFCLALAALVNLVKKSNKFNFPQRTLFHFLSPHRPATWAGRRGWQPFS